MLGHVNRAQQPLISGAIRGIFTATSGAEARDRLAQVVDQLTVPAPKVSQRLEDAEVDLLAFYAFPTEHWPKLRSTNPLERLNREIGRRSDVIGIFPNDAALIRPAGALLIEQHDEWLVGRRYLSEASMAKVLAFGQESLPKTGSGRERAPDHGLSRRRDPCRRTASYTTNRYLTDRCVRESKSRGATTGIHARQARSRGG